MIAYPRHLTWKFTKSSPPPLAASMPSSPPSGKSYEEGARAEDDTIEAACASHGDLELNFDLEKSIYATMFIREIAKNIY